MWPGGFGRQVLRITRRNVRRKREVLPWRGLRAEELADNLDWWEATWQNHALLEPLLAPGTPLREMGRLGSDNLGRMLAELLPTGLIKPGRWQKTLAEVARGSRVHALVVQQSLQSALQGDPQTMPRDYGKLLELLQELSIETGQSINCQPAREFLAKVKGSGKAASTAKALLTIEPTPFNVSGHPLMRQALDQRIQAAMARQELGQT